MNGRGVVVGACSVVAMALAAGGSSSLGASSSASAGGAVGGRAGALGFGSGSSGAALGGVLWLVVLMVLVAAAAWVVVDRARRGPRDVTALRGRFVALVLAVAVAGVLLVAIRVLEDGNGPAGPDGVGGPLLQGQPEGASATAGPGPGVVLAVLLALVVVVLAALAVHWYRRSDAPTDAFGENDDGDGDPDADGRGVDERPRTNASALGAAAGRAAESLDGDVVPSENDVVRAWRELAAVLAVSRPASSTPREFAATATAAGVDARDVEELTALFEAVRYGDREATADRARRALAALERIEGAQATAADAGTRPTTSDSGRSGSGESS